MQEYDIDRLHDDELADMILAIPTHFVDYTIVAANVAISSGGSVNNNFNAGATITQGQAVYYNTATGKWSLALANGTALQSGNGTAYGISLNSALANQPLSVYVPTPGTSCKIQTGVATTVVGVMVVVSAAAAGGIAPQADLASTNYFTYLGWWTTTAGVMEMMGSSATGLTKA